MVRILATGPSCPSSDPSSPKIFSEEKIVDVAEVNEWRCFEESEQWLENVDRTHLVFASGKLVLQNVREVVGSCPFCHHFRKTWRQKT